MPKESSNDVLSAGVREPLEVFEDWLCSTVFEMFVPRFVFRFDLRDLDALAHPRFDGIDRRAKLEEERVISSGDETAVEATFHATHEGEFDGIPSTGETIAVPFVSIITISDDGITSWRDYWDQQTFVEQLGLD